MARDAIPKGLLPSLLDRLVDPDLGGGGELGGYTQAEMVNAVRRDLEELLNTRQWNQEALADYPELSRSTAGYGLPDFASFDAEESTRKPMMGRIIENLITTFEPRLIEVRAVPVESEGSAKDPHRVQFQIEGRLHLDPNPRVEFATVVELLTGAAEVKSGVAEP